MQPARLVSCLIPFHNEWPRIKTVLMVATTVWKARDILCVDDGSTDNGHVMIKKTFPGVRVLCLPRQLGKSGAVKAGLSHIKTPYVCLLDGDLTGLTKQEIVNAVNAIIHNPSIAMIVLRRMHAMFLTKCIRADILFPGERILRTNDLAAVLKEKKPKNYLLEIAINQYFFEKRALVYWMPSSAVHTFKVVKWGIMAGLLKEIAMTVSIISWIGIRNFFKQMAFFARREYH